MSEPTAAIGLSDEQLSSYEENGFLAIERLLDESDLRPLEDEYDRLLDRQARRLYSRGEIPSAFAGAPFGDRFARVHEHDPELHRHFNISLPLVNGEVDPERYHAHTGPAVFGFLRNRKILDAVESIIGPEISSSPVQQMRMKPPVKGLAASNAVHSNIGMTTWHQDIVAILPEADETQQLTVWVAVTEATVENGCLLSVPGSHRLGPAIHCSNGELASEPHVPAALMEGRTVVPLPVKRGGVVLFHKMNLHRSLPNRSNRLRWSVDLRYHPIGQATGRPAFPGFVARSRSNPSSELRDADEWARRWGKARAAIVSGRYKGPIFADSRWHDEAVC